MAKGYGATDVVIAGAIDQSIIFALEQGGLPITGLKLDWVRYNENNGTSFDKPSRGTYPLALTELTNYNDAHTDGKAKFIDTDATGALQRLIRVDFPDIAFATGKMKIVCNVLDDGNNVVGQRIFDLRGNDSAYVNGAVWVDVTNGLSPGTTLPYVHGTPADPLNSIAGAKSIADGLGLNRFQLVGPNGQAELATPDYSEGYEFISDSIAKIALDYATVANCAFKGCHINSSQSSISIGAGKFQMNNCLFGHATTLYLPRVFAKDCAAYGIIQFVSTGIYEFAGLKCIDTQVTLDLGSAIGAQTVIITGFSGKLNLKNIKTGDVVLVMGEGEVRIDATCTSGTLRIAGPIFIESYAAGTVVTNLTTQHVTWNELKADHTTANTFGDFLDGKISAIATAVWALGTRTLTSFGTLVADITTAVWASSTRTLTSFGTLVADTTSAVWASGTRTLTSFGTLVADIWVSGTRTLTSFGTLVADTTSAVWASGTRTLTSFGTLVSDIATAVWSAGTRTLTSFGTLVVDTTSAVWSAVVRTLTGIGSSGIASEANATANRNTLQAEHVLLNNGHTALGLQSTNIQSRIPTTLQSGRMQSNVDAIGGNATIDGTSLIKWAELVQAMVNGRFKKDFPVAGQLTLYKRDNVTVLTVLSVTDTERTRIS